MRVASNTTMLAMVKLLLLLPLTMATQTPNLLQLMTELQLTTFRDGIIQCGLDRIINHEGHFTIFAPNNEAFKNEKWYPGEDNFCDKMAFHITKGLHEKAAMSNEMTVKSLLAKRTIRINIYSFHDNVVTANGRPVITTDHPASNGVIHILAEVMSSVYAKAGSVVSEIDECCPEHADLLELLKLSGLYHKLDSEGPFTLLAPNNGAFAKLPPDFWIHLKKNRTAMVNLLKGHVLPATLYTAGLPDNALTVTTLSGSQVKLFKSGGKVMVGKASVTLPDITAGNGAIHAIDEVLFAGRRKSPSLVDVCREHGFTDFADALVATGLDRVVNQGGAFTIFAPSNDAFRRPLGFKLSDWVRFHIGRGLVKPMQIRDGDHMMTLLNRRTIRWNVYTHHKQEEDWPSGRLITANGRAVEFLGHEAVNGVVNGLQAGMDYIYDANGTLSTEISKWPQFTLFAELISDYYPNILSHSAQFAMTVLVPANRHLEARLKAADEAEVARNLLLNHLVPLSWYKQGWCLAGSVKNLGGRELTLNCTHHHINGIPMGLTDLSAGNGVFHEVEGLL